MRAVVVYESMYGNTHLIAEAIARGLSASAGDAATWDVTVTPVSGADRATLEGAELVVVGGPTHVHGMTRESTRKAAVEAAEKPDADLTLDPDAEGPGLRDWFDELDRVEAMGAAFDTRLDASPVVTGRASKGISKRLRRHGFNEVVPPESFLVTKQNELEPHEQERAEDWGRSVAAAVGASVPNRT
jgi:hypothetical protein